MKNVSRKISYLLRHNPEDLLMDKEGWVMTSQLLTKLNIRLKDLEEIVETNDKKRFSFNENKTKIRANQGHSKNLGIKIDYDVVKFPTTYFHGTATKNVRSILKNGLNSGKREFVHLSKDIETATLVALRHSKDVSTLAIDGSQMKFDGYNIYESENGVILTEEVPPKYLRII